MTLPRLLANTRSSGDCGETSRHCRSVLTTIGLIGTSRFPAFDFGEPIDVLPGEVPLYWGCGLTALSALQQAAIPFFITHAAGSMLVTDLRDDELEETPS